MEWNTLGHSVHYIMATLEVAFKQAYGDSFGKYMWENRPSPPTYMVPKYYNLDRRLGLLLDFKNEAGDIVMTQKDNYKFVFHDKPLQDAMKRMVSLK